LREVPLHELRIFVDLVPSRVVSGSVREAKAHVKGKLFRAGVHGAFNFLPDSAKANGLLDHLEIIWDIQCDRVYLVHEPYPLLVFFTGAEYCQPFGL
jgi:hypothetical protein